MRTGNTFRGNYKGQASKKKNAKKNLATWTKY